MGNDNSNTSSISVTRSNSTNLQDVQSPTEGQNATHENRNVAEDNYATGQNLDMDGLSELLRALSHQQGMRQSISTIKEISSIPDSHASGMNQSSESKSISTLTE